MFAQSPGKITIRKMKKLTNQGNRKRDKQFAGRMRKQYKGYCGNKINGFNLKIRLPLLLASKLFLKRHTGGLDLNSKLHGPAI